MTPSTAIHMGPIGPLFYGGTEGTYPHSRKYREQILEAAGPEDAHKIFVGNAARIYGFDESRLRVAA